MNENILTYLRFRGDLTFKQDPFNEVDALILCMLSYISFPDFDKIIDLSSVSLDLLAHRDQELVQLVMNSKRFQYLKIVDYQDIQSNDKIVQFAAMTFKLSPLLYFIAFRGTDDSFVGGKKIGQ